MDGTKEDKGIKNEQNMECKQMVTKRLLALTEYLNIIIYKLAITLKRNSTKESGYKLMFL